MKKIIYLPFFLLVFSTSCQKKALNPAKTIHENQLSLKSNGKLQALPVSASVLTPSSLTIEAGSTALSSGKYEMYIRSDISPGFYEYGASSSLLSFYFLKDNKVYETYDGTFRILSNDTVAKRLEFQFQLKLYNVNFPSDQYKITEGNVTVSY